MAWYRCGGGGLPAGLQSDMDTVLNKKFSTSTTYPPTDWPDTVNLMGPLPEKTASGAIANITDGADGVPLKNWLVTLPASLDGYTEVNGVQAGGNLFILPENSFSVGDMDFRVENESLIIDGQAPSGANISSKNQAFKDNFSFGLPAGTYYFTRGSWSRAVYVYDLSDDSTALATNTGSFTLSKYTVVYVGFYISANTVITETTFNGYIVQGSSASSYSPQWSRKYTAQLGRTIYGGTADIVTGEGEDENGNAFTFTPITPTPETALGVNNFWADEGDSDVTYRADISLALQALGGGGRGLMMMRPTEPEETEETEETEGLEDELNR